MAIFVDESSRVLVQGITGREAVSMTRACLDYGTHIVGGVTPGKGGGEVFGVPVYDSVSEAFDAHHPNVSVISVPAVAVLEASLEAISQEIPLIVIVSERVPRRDVVRILAAAEEAGARVVGPNSLGIISPGRSKVGGIGGPAEDVRRAYQPGPVGVISRSGGMTTEIASLLTEAGLGQSTCISIGGDPLIGTRIADAVDAFEEDPDTEAVVFFSEPGGSQEAELAAAVARGANSGEARRLPIVGFVAGLFADEMPGMRFGHAGAMVEPGGTTTRDKVEELRAAGVTVVDRLGHLPEAVREGMGARR